MRLAVLVHVAFLSAGCGPSVVVEEDPPATYCTVESTKEACAYRDGAGVCLSVGVCAVPCGSVGDCPPPWDPCLATSCDYAEQVSRAVCRYASSCS
jgi:hypothetical protein